MWNRLVVRILSITSFLLPQASPQYTYIYRYTYIHIDIQYTIYNANEIKSMRPWDRNISWEWAIRHLMKHRWNCKWKITFPFLNNFVFIVLILLLYFKSLCDSVLLSCSLFYCLFYFVLIEWSVVSTQLFESMNIINNFANSPFLKGRVYIFI